MSGTQEPRLILAYVILALGALTLSGAIGGNAAALLVGSLMGYLTAMVHGVSFVVRSRKRREPAMLAGTARAILAVTLGVVGAAAFGNFVTVAIYFDRPAVTAANGTTALAWAIAILVLCWRVWIHPSARRAAALQIIAVVFAVPAIFFKITELDMRMRPYDRHAALLMTTSLLITFIVVGVAGAVLDKLFASVHDRRPDVIPKAIVQ